MKTPGHAATALQALEELRLEEDAAHQAAIRAGQVVALKDALHKLRSITYDCKIDWEGILGKIIGKIPARLFCKTFVGLIRINNKVRQEVTKNLIESIQEEVDIVPSLDEFTELSSNIRNLATNADRLEARIKKLKSQVFDENKQDKQ